MGCSRIAHHPRACFQNKNGGVGAQIGSIEKGKVADLILTDGDPLETRTNIKEMFIAGKEVSLETRQTREYEKWLKRP